MPRHKKTINLGILSSFLMILLFFLVVWGIGWVRKVIDERLRQNLTVEFQNNAKGLSIPRYTGKENPIPEPPKMEEPTSTPKETIGRGGGINTAGLTYASFSDLFSGVGWLNQEKTTMYRDNVVTAFIFPPKYEWKETNPSPDVATKLRSLTNQSATIGNDTLSVKGRSLSFNSSDIALPEEVRNLDIENISVSALQTKWLLGVVVKKNGGYEGYIYGYNGKTFSKVQAVFSNQNLFTSSYSGAFGFGGTDTDWIAIYGAYRGIGIHVKNGNVEDISRLLSYRLMNNGFVPMILRVDGSHPTWFVWSLTPGNPKLVKLFQNNTDEIRGAVDFTPQTLLDMRRANFVVKGESLLGYVGSENSMKYMELKDEGFDKSVSRSIYSVNLNNYPAEIHAFRVYEEDLSREGGDVKIYLSNDGDTWVPASLKETIGFPNPSGRRLYWKADVVPDSDPRTSPFFDFLGIEYYVKFL